MIPSVLWQKCYGQDNKSTPQQSPNTNSNNKLSTSKRDSNITDNNIKRQFLTEEEKLLLQNKLPTGQVEKSKVEKKSKK